MNDRHFLRYQNMQFIVFLGFMLLNLISPICFDQIWATSVTKEPIFVDPEITADEYINLPRYPEELDESSQWHNMAHQILRSKQKSITIKGKIPPNNINYCGVDLVIKNTQTNARRRLFFTIQFDQSPEKSNQFLLSGGFGVLNSIQPKEAVESFTSYRREDKELFQRINATLFKPNIPEAVQFGFTDTENVLIGYLYKGRFNLEHNKFENSSNLSFGKNECLEQVKLNIASIKDLCPWCYTRLKRLMMPDCTEITKIIFQNIIEKYYNLTSIPTYDIEELWGRMGLNVCVSSEELCRTPINKVVYASRKIETENTNNRQYMIFNRQEV